MGEAYPVYRSVPLDFFLPGYTSPAHCSRCLRLRAQWDAEGVAERARVTEASIDYHIGTVT